ncbi:UNVERIFIED_CONTAM: hypothetical protein Sradi_2001600 [Sesamum radiatum]|uniref:Uncharacterized protein n=1 Tax=Sesamum radiatum TaxID=300843 RepID=A0AAW2THB2_SESRA
MSSARIGPARRSLGSKKGQCPRLDSRNNRIPLVRTSSESTVSTPGGNAPDGSRFPVRPPAGTRRPLSAAGDSSSSSPTADGFGTGPPCPALRANPFPEVTDPFCRLPLPYIVPSTRGCSPWRPDAVMSTTGRRTALGPPDFSRAAGGAPDTTRRAVLFQPLDPTSG